LHPQTPQTRTNTTQLAKFKNSNILFLRPFHRTGDKHQIKLNHFPVCNSDQCPTFCSPPCSTTSHVLTSALALALESCRQHHQPMPAQAEHPFAPSSSTSLQTRRRPQRPCPTSFWNSTATPIPAPAQGQAVDNPDHAAPDLVCHADMRTPSSPLAPLTQTTSRPLRPPTRSPQHQKPHRHSRLDDRDPETPRPSTTSACSDHGRRTTPTDRDSALPCDDVPDDHQATTRRPPTVLRHYPCP